MEMWEIDLKVNVCIQNGEYDQAERFLEEQYAEIKVQGNLTALRHILGGLAMFYRLPFKSNPDQAAFYYREMEAAFPDRETDLELAGFYFSSLRDFAKTIDKVEAMGAS